MKDCKNCKYFCGYDYSDGTPICEHNGGYEACPYNDTADFKLNEAKLEVDMTNLLEYITHTVKNSVEMGIYKTAHDEIVSLVKDTYNKTFEKYTKEEVEKQISNSVNEFMEETVTIGGNWGEEPKKLTRKQYLNECVKNSLEEKFDIEHMRTTILQTVQKEVKKKADILKRQVNSGIKQTIDDVMAKTLTDSVVTMLMCSDSYQKLNDSMKRLIH